MVPLHAIKGPTANIYENTWIRNKALYIIKRSIRKYPPHFPTFAHFHSQRCSSSFSLTFWHLSLTTCLGFPLAHQLPCQRHTAQMAGLAADNRENWLAILVVQMLFLFFSEKLPLADRALSVCPGLLPLTPDTSSSGGELSILALCAFFLHWPPT